MNLTFKYELWKLTEIYKLNNKYINLLNKLLYTKKVKAIINQENDFYNNLDGNHYDLAEENIEEMIELGLDESSPRIIEMKTTLEFEKTYE